MTVLLGIDFAARFASLFSGKVVSITLTKNVSNNTYNASDPTAGATVTQTSYTCQGASDSVGQQLTKDGSIGDSMRNDKFKIIILLGTMSTPGVIPQPGDQITFTPPGQSTTITASINRDGVKMDGAGASATCSCSTNAV